MLTFLVRRALSIFVMLLVVSFAAYWLFYNAPGGPLQMIAEMQQSGRNQLDAGAVDRIKLRFDLDLNHGVRYMRWLTGFPNGPIEIGGQQMFSGAPIGCLKEAPPGQKVILQYADGSQIETNCLRPTYLQDLTNPNRRVSKGALRLDFGISQLIARERPVLELIETRLAPTLLLMGVANVLAILIAVPIGVLSAVKQYSRFDYFVTTVTFFGSAMPTLFLGIMGILFFSLFLRDMGLPFLPPQLAESNRDAIVPLLGEITAGSLGDRIWHLVLPVAVLTFVSLTGWSRFVRSSMLEVLKQDYVRTARAKGVRETMVIMKHAFRNSMIPFVTLLVGVLPSLFAGAIVTESIFSWPGLGRLYVQALGGDYTVAMAILLISTFLTLISFLLADVLYTIVDPRIRLS